MATTPALPASHIHYPEADGKPIAETDTHCHAILDTIATLKEYFRTAPDVYVSGNLLLYYEAGNPTASVAPDVFVVHGIPKGARRTYKLWEEGRAPTAVIEFTSRSTRLEDLGNKRFLYASLGVREYFLCDPLGEYLDPPLQGYELVEGEYVRLTEDVGGALLSRGLGLRLQREDVRLRLVQVATGERLLWPDELAALSRAEIVARLEAEGRALQAESRAHAEADARHTAEERLAATEAELVQLRAELARRRDAPDGGSQQDQPLEP